MVDRINRQYFKWMSGIIDGTSYSKLLWSLHNTRFTARLQLDEDREEDGSDLRGLFKKECGYGSSDIHSEFLNTRPCSILEMMVALCIRCENHIMDNPDIGDRTSQWFWDMIESLGLSGMRDTNFDEAYTERTIARFNNREYFKNGRGGLFTSNDENVNMLDMDIWYQMCCYLNTIL